MKETVLKDFLAKVDTGNLKIDQCVLASRCRAAPLARQSHKMDAKACHMLSSSPLALWCYGAAVTKYHA